jgi:hypothetical protein
MLLVLFYAEELKRDVLDRIQTTDSLMARLSKGASSERVPAGTKNPLNKALNALVADRAITSSEKDEIVSLIDYRNVIAHQMHNLLVDLSPDPVARGMLTYLPERLPKYDHDAVERLQQLLSKLHGLYRTHHYVTHANTNSSIFDFAERTFLREIRRLNQKIAKLAKLRRAQVTAINSELSLAGSGLVGDLHPRHPLNQYDNRRLTRRGAEICYRLFDLGKSPVAVAHLTGMSLTAARKRKRTWQTLGGSARTKVDIATIPHRKFYRYDDD